MLRRNLEKVALEDKWKNDFCLDFFFDKHLSYGCAPLTTHHFAVETSVPCWTGHPPL